MPQMARDKEPHLEVVSTLGDGLGLGTLENMTLQTNPEIPADIQRLVEDYFDLMHPQDMEVFGRVFHKDSVLYGVVDG